VASILNQAQVRYPATGFVFRAEINPSPFFHLQSARYDFFNSLAPGYLPVLPLKAKM
jgi:hypothetical protein